MNIASLPTFDNLMSIGTACKTRYQLERILKSRRNGWKQHTYFFDWLMCGGVRGAQKIIEAKFQLARDEFCCDTLNTEGNHIPLHRPSGYRFLHDLGCTKETRQSRELATQAMNDAMDGFLSKYAYIGSQTHGLLAGSDVVGLVYCGGLTPPAVTSLMDCLQSHYRKRFTLINVINASAPVDADNLITLKVDDTPVLGTADEWRGCNEAWDRAFADIRTS